jgi:hypothetical protein
MGNGGIMGNGNLFLGIGGTEYLGIGGEFVLGSFLLLKEN